MGVFKWPINFIYIYLFKNKITKIPLFTPHENCLKKTKAKSKRGFTSSGLLHLPWSLTWTWCLWILKLRHCPQGSPRAVEASTSIVPSVNMPTAHAIKEGFTRGTPRAVKSITPRGPSLELPLCQKWLRYLFTREHQGQWSLPCSLNPQ